MSASAPTTGASAEETFDIVVIGSGAAGMVCALAAHLRGLRPLIVEKTGFIGGSTAISGGGIWVPLTDEAAAAGHQDSAERVREYLARTLGRSGNPETIDAFLANGARAVRELSRHTRLQLVPRVHSPDYYPDEPGATLAGRVLDCVPFDGRELGAHFRQLRRPLDDFLIFGGMMVTIVDVRHLLAAHRSLRSAWHAARLLLRQARDRAAGWGRGTRLLLGNALAGRLLRSVLDAGIAYRLETQAIELVVASAADGARRVEGVVVEDTRGRRVIRARAGVLVATGGFSWSPEMRAQHYPAPDHPRSMAPRSAVGEGITMALAAGATMGRSDADPAFWAPVSVLRRPDGTEHLYPHLVWDRAKPGLLAVNAAGRRFVNESASYHDFVRALYKGPGRPNQPAWLLCDHDFMRRWGLGLARPGGLPRGHLVRAGYLHRASSLDELATQLGIDVRALMATVAAFNASAAQGVDAEFGKGGNAYNRSLGDPAHQPNPCLGPIRRAPFYAVRVYPADVGTAWGIRTDGHARALAADGRAIEGLYVAGNDMHSIPGGEYPAPGIALGPAITFGWLAAQHAADRLRAAATPSAPAPTPTGDSLADTAHTTPDAPGHRRAPAA